MAEPPEEFTVQPASVAAVVYRCVDRRQPGPEAFLSDEADGRTENLARSHSMALQRGLSVRETLEQARSLARRIRKSYVAEVELTWHEGDSIARTFKTVGHHTVWAHPSSLARRVRRVYRVRDNREMP